MNTDMTWQPPATEWERVQLADRISRHPGRYSAQEVDWFLNEYFDRMPWQRKALLFIKALEWQWSFLGAFWAVVSAVLLLTAFSGGGFLVFGLALVTGGYATYLFAGGSWRIFIF